MTQDDETVEVMAKGMAETAFAGRAKPWVECEELEQAAWLKWARSSVAALRAAGYEVIQWKPIAEAPTDGSVVPVFAPSKYGLPAMTTSCAYHPDAGWCVDELREVTHYAILTGPQGGKHD